MRIAALFFGLVAGLFALLAPSAMRGELMAQFMQHWSQTANDRLMGTAIWFGLPSVAILGGLLAILTPGLAVIPLTVAALGWASIGLLLGDFTEPQIAVPAVGAGLAAVLALVAAELRVRRRRMERRRRRELIAGGEPSEDESEREAALRLDPVVLEPKDEAAPTRRVVPLDIDIATRSERVAEPQLEKPGRDMWGEAIRPQADDVIEPEPVPPEPEVVFEPEPQVRGFRWDRADAPPGLEPDDRPGPRLVRRPTLEVVAEPVHRAQAPQRQTPPEPEPARMVAQVEPLPEAAVWDEPAQPRRRGGLVAALMAIVAGLAIGVLVVGGYLAYRDGWVDRLVALVQPAEDAGGPTEGADTPVDDPVLPAGQLAPSADQPAPIAVLPSTPAATGAADTAALNKVADSHRDPFAYCGAVGTVDYVDGRYSGPMVTPAIVRALGLPESATRDRVHWRCVDGAVLACASYIGPICDMAPTPEEMREYCARYTAAPQLMAPGGVWSCVDGLPRLPPEAKWPVDARGFRADAWVVVPETAG